MTIARTVTRWGAARASRRLSRSIPFIGTFIALGALGVAVRQKGMLRGSADTALNAMPFIGALKTAVEVVRGRDIFADKPPVRAR